MEPLDFDWRNPDYVKVFQDRAAALKRIRAEPELLPALKAYYKEFPAQFITDWGITYDPKNVERDLPSIIPFVLFPKQAEWVDWIVDHWRNQKPGIVEKTRQIGMSWLSVATACTLCLFHDGLAIGFGSRKEIYVDSIGDPKSLFHKARTFLQNLPVEFRGGWQVDKHAPHMRIQIPETGATLTGEAGDNIGRGNTTSIYFVDEAAFLERPQLIEASLSQTTNCRIDISTPNGLANPFAEKRHGGKIDVFTFHWRDDPRKDDVWYQKQLDELDPVTVAQEIDIDYAASVEGVVIPNAWIRASVDAHKKLGIEPTGEKSAALDVADGGKDMNALCGSHGILVNLIEEWSGKGSDIFFTVQKAFTLCDLNEYRKLRYDADGLGVGVKGDARIINEKRPRFERLDVEAFRGSETPFNPEGEDVKGRKNKDFFANRKAQAWWSLRTRFQNTYRAVTEGQKIDPDQIISLASNLKHLQKLINELSQPTYGINQVGKILIDKSPEGTKSPNLADSVMIKFASVTKPALRINAIALHRA